MSVNIMDLVKGAVSNQVMGQLGGLLGQTDQKKTSSMFETASAAILGGLMKKAGSGDGGRQVFEAVQNTDTGILDKLGDLLGGGDQTDQFQKQGGGIMDMVFGSQQSGIIGTLSKVLGLDKSMIGKLLTMAAPILMSVIGGHVKKKALDMVGFGNMLSSQKSHLGGYLPNNLTSDLGLGNLVSDAGAAGRQAVAGASNAANQAAQGGGSLMKMLLPLILLAALAFGAFKMFGGGAPADVEDVPDINVTEGLGDGLTMPEIDFGSLGEAGEKLKGLQGQFSGITDGFKGLTDEAGANDLKGKLEGLTGSVGDLGLGDLTGAAKTSAGTMVGGFVEAIRGFVDKIENPLLKGIVQPAVDGLLAKLEGLGL